MGRASWCAAKGQFPHHTPSETLFPTHTKRFSPGRAETPPYDQEMLSRKPQRGTRGSTVSRARSIWLLESRQLLSEPVTTGYDIQTYTGATVLLARPRQPGSIRFSKSTRPWSIRRPHNTRRNRKYRK